MKYQFDVNWGGLMFSPLDEAIKHNAQWWAETLPMMLAQIRQHFEEDGIDERELLKWFNEFRDKYCERRGNRLVPTPTGIKKIKKANQRIAPYRDMVDTMSMTTGPVKLMPELYRIYEVMSGIMDIFDNYCIDDSELENLFNEGVNPNEPVTSDAVEEEEDTAPVGQTTDFSHMRSFTPVTEYNMSGLYQFLVDEQVIVGVDEKQFADCINQANIKPLWETTKSKNLFKLFLHTLKRYYQDTYQQRRKDNPKWFLVCCESIDATTEYMGKMNFPKEDTKVKFCENLKDSVQP